MLVFDAETLSQIVQEYPDSKKAPDDILLHGPLPNIHPVRFRLIDEEMVRKTAIKTKGGSGPSCMDVECCHRILASNQFGTSNTDLCKAFTEVIRRLCTSLIKT